MIKFTRASKHIHTKKLKQTRHVSCIYNNNEYIILFQIEIYACTCIHSIKKTIAMTPPSTLCIHAFNFACFTFTRTVQTTTQAKLS